MQNISKPSGKYPQLDWLPNVGVLCSSLTWSETFDLRARRDKNSFRRFVSLSFGLRLLVGLLLSGLGLFPE
ncbi:BnaC09g20410D [Brassica napus]|uniref:BnaC09g20410D protein n=1 Tax=Brassica napus TaxID=3708 RepID=A0A078GKN4_BRANA|nr:BnaC09g20410D [Brassica napus]